MPIPIAPDIDPSARPERALHDVELHSGGHAETAIPGIESTRAFEHEAGATYAVINGSPMEESGNTDMVEGAAQLAVESLNDYSDQYTRMPPQPKTRADAKHHVIGALKHINKIIEAGSQHILRPDRPELDMAIVALTTETSANSVSRRDPKQPQRRDMVENTTMYATVGNAGDGEVVRVRGRKVEVIGRPESEEQPKLGANGRRESFKTTEVEIEQGDMIFVVSPQVRELIEAEPGVIAACMLGATSIEEVSANLVAAANIRNPGSGGAVMGINIETIPGPKQTVLDYDYRDISRKAGRFAHSFEDRSERWDEVLSPERIAENHAETNEEIKLEKAYFRATHGRRPNRAERNAIAEAAKERGINRIMVEMIRGNELRDRFDHLVNNFTATHGFVPTDADRQAIWNQAFQETLNSLPDVADLTDSESEARSLAKFLLEQPERSIFRESRSRRARQRKAYQRRDAAAHDLHHHYDHKAERLSGRRFRQMARTAIEGTMDISADGLRKTGRGVRAGARAVRRRLPI